MAIPDFQSMMLPLLQLHADGKDHSNLETYRALQAHFNLTEAEVNEMLPSGNTSVFRNRVAWSKAYMKRAGLLSQPSRGVYVITPLGLETLAANPDGMSIRQLKDMASQMATPENTEAECPASLGEAASTPRELLEQGARQAHEALIATLLDVIRGNSPSFFERLVIDLLLAMGYGGSREDAGRSVTPGPDGGIDGVINEDRLGLDTIYIQAKRWDKTVVGRPEVQKFAGALQERQTRKGVFITTSSFTRDARQYVERIANKIVLIDGEALARLMIEHNVGVAREALYEIKKIDQDYFLEE